ncbi:MAG: twin-arginine translocation signal domain-containing protein, partial [Planctomycetaceae bacterium]|nr:twin-arginine translocation signal domain-containing protein [Planctomycetaceae bacterium]
MRHPLSVHDNKSVAGRTNRREFIKIVTMAAASVGLTSSAAIRIAEAAARGLKPSVIW